MGSKRVGLARTQALIEGLKRELNLAGTTLNEPKGVELCKFGAATSIPVAEALVALNTVTVPAGCMITDVGILATTALGAGSGGTIVKFNAGFASAAADDLVALTNICDANSISTANSMASAATGTRIDATGAALAFAADAQALYRETETIVYGRIENNLAVADAIGSVQLFVRYIMV